jgi:hypothetical protein
MPHASEWLAPPVGLARLILLPSVTSNDGLNPSMVITLKGEQPIAGFWICGHNLYIRVAFTTDPSLLHPVQSLWLLRSSQVPCFGSGI